jgi:DUF438 domain-containing protein
MSEHINNQARRQAVLKRLSRELHEGKSFEEVKDKFGALLQDVTRTHALQEEKRLLDEGV